MTIYQSIKNEEKIWFVDKLLVNQLQLMSI